MAQKFSKIFLKIEELRDCFCAISNLLLKAQILFGQCTFHVNLALPLMGNIHGLIGS
jgi:hypothetical protein